jgi:hypothetical protein
VEIHINKDDVKYVCTEAELGQDWFYDGSIGIYYRLNEAAKNVTARIYGKHLPDPKALASDPDRRKPTPTTYKLWEHWQSAS